MVTTRDPRLVCEAANCGLRFCFAVRDGREGYWDRGVVNEVVTADCYRMQALRRSGFSPARILDVGAHIGVFIAFVKRLWPAAEVLAFEPWLPNFALALENTKGLAGVGIIPAALIAGSDEERAFRPPDDNTGGGTVAAEGKETVPCHDGAAIVRTFRPDIVKLDCEGSERELLRSFHAAGLLDGIGVIVGEYHGADIKSEIASLLARSHRLTFGRPGNLGLFYADKRPDVPPEDRGERAGEW